MVPSDDWKDDVTAEALHGELCAAIADLAKSVEVAVQRMAFRARCNAAIAGATKAEFAAEFLRVAAAHSPEPEEQEFITTVPLLTASSRQENRSDVEVYTPGPADELYSACHWLAATQIRRTTPEEDSYREESKIAMRVFELQVRLGGLIKK
jgi:hypothetical protein